MTDLFQGPTFDAFLALAILASMFSLFVTERWPAEVIALGAVAAMLATGILPFDAALLALSNPAPWTIAAMFIMAGALVRTGALEPVARLAETRAETNPALAIATLIGFAIFASAFVNNTPVVLIMIPIFVRLAKKLNVSASKFLIPLSYASILGGTLTLLGTSTNLIVAGLAQSHDLQRFSIFEITPLAIVLVVWGILYLRIVAPRLLPERTSIATLLSGQSGKKFFAEVAIPEDSSLIGQNVAKIESFQRNGMRVIDVVRGDTSMRQNLTTVSLQAGDRVVLRTQMEELLGLQDEENIRMVHSLGARRTTTVEMLISPGATLVGQRLGALRLRRRYGIYVLAVHRRDRHLEAQFDSMTLRVGDTLLLEGAPEDIARLAADAGAVNVNEPSARAFRRKQAPIAIAALGGIVVLAALGVAPILFLAILAVSLVLFTRCIDAEEAMSFVDGRLLLLIFCMLAVGVGLESAGAVSLIVSFVGPYLQLMPPFLVVWSLYLLTSLLTELVSNNAVAVVLTPLAINLGVSLGVDPRPLVIAVMIAASASFATPIGYQTNMMVYGPGGYRFSDFLRVGIPLNLSVGLLASFLIPLFWPLQAAN